MKLISLFLISLKCLVVLLSETELCEVKQLIRYSTLGIQNYMLINLTIPLDLYVYKITYFLFKPMYLMDIFQCITWLFFLTKYQWLQDTDLLPNQCMLVPSFKKHHYPMVFRWKSTPQDLRVAVARKDPLWFMWAALGAVWCEVSRWRAMNNSAPGPVTSSLFPCYCCFYVIAKWKINWCHQESCIICLGVHIRIRGAVLLLCEPCMMLQCAKLEMCEHLL